MVTQWLIFLAAMLLAAVLLDAMRQRERALHIARQLCKQRDMQLLDETVGLGGLRLRRGGDGVLHLERRYTFEVSLDGHDRHAGHLWTVAGHLLASSLPQSAEDRAGQSSAVDPDTSRRRRLH